jgi:hypothetical protein
LPALIPTWFSFHAGFLDIPLQRKKCALWRCIIYYSYWNAFCWVNEEMSPVFS